MINVQLYTDSDELVEVEFRATNHRYKVNGSYVLGVSTILGTLNKDLMGWASMMAADYFKEQVKPFATSERKMTQMALNDLAKQARNAHMTKSQKGKDVGTIVHEWIKEETDKNREVHMPAYAAELLGFTPEEEQSQIKENILIASHCVNQWRQWKIDYDIEILASEFIVYSKKLGYCGTVDLVFRSRKTGKLYIGDYKTSEPQKVRNSKYVVTGHKAYPEHFAQIAAYDYAYSEETGFAPDSYAVIYLPKEGPYQMFIREEIDYDRQGWEHLFHVHEWLSNIKKG